MASWWWTGRSRTGSRCSILVVDGTITDGESVFRLSRSVGITDDIRSADTITNAEVSVERSDGMFFEASQESKGAYRAINGALDPNLEYRLNISLGWQALSIHLLETFDIRRDRQPQLPEERARGAGDDPCVEPCRTG